MNAPDPVDLLDRLPSEIALLPALVGEPPYRSLQVFQWVHQHRVRDFERMTNLPRALRGDLARSTRISRMDPVEVIPSRDGSEKMIFRGSDGRRFPAVLMPSEDRVTLCVSSQVGCRMGCRFCLTGQGGFVRHLSAAEIVGQVHAAMDRLPAGSRVTNVVFMGMGEPFDNLPEVLRAVRVITHREGLRVAPRRTTLSTVGLVERLPEVLESVRGVSIALSLCATTDEVRNEVVPAARRHGDLRTVLDALTRHTLPHGHVYTIEYTLIAGVGDSPADARRLSRMLSRFPHKVNLIPFNPWPGSPYRRPDDGTVEAFRRVLADRNHPVTIRRSRGQDIGAACGQLGTAPEGGLGT